MDSRYFIPRLAFFDFLLCLAFGIFEIIVVNVSYIHGSICKIFFFLTTFASCTSNAFLLAIAVQRFLVVCQPFGTQMTLSLRRWTTALIIATNFLFSVPVLIIAGKQGHLKNHKTESLPTARCSFSNDQYPTFQIIYIVILGFVSIAYIIVTVGMYIPITFVIYRHFSKTRNKNTENTKMARREYAINVQEGNLKVGPEAEIENLDKGMTISKINVVISQRKKSTVSKNENGMQALVLSRSSLTYAKSPVTNFKMMFFIIICIYVFTYVPTITVMILDSLNHFNDNALSQNYTILFFLSACYVVNHVINPFIYAYFDKQMRNKIRSMVRAILRGCLKECQNFNWGQYCMYSLKIDVHVCTFY